MHAAHEKLKPGSQIFILSVGILFLGGCESVGDAAKSSGSGQALVGTELEWVNAFALCMREAGFEVDVDERVPSFEAAADLPEDQVEAYNATFDQCRTRLGGPPVDATALDLPALYEATVAAKTCLEQLGYRVSQPPSMEVWIDSYERGPWLPHSDLQGLSEAEWTRVNEKCPQP